MDVYAPRVRQDLLQEGSFEVQVAARTIQCCCASFGAVSTLSLGSTEQGAQSCGLQPRESGVSRAVITGRSSESKASEINRLRRSRRIHEIGLCPWNA